jgi:hypothetical protein
MKVDGQHHSGRFNPGKEAQYPMYRRLGGPQDRSGWARKISPPPGCDPRPVQSVASRYTELSRPTTKSNEFRVIQHRISRSLGSSVCLVTGLRYRRHWTRDLIADTSKTKVRTRPYRPSGSLSSLPNEQRELFPPIMLS